MITGEHDDGEADEIFTGLFFKLRARADLGDEGFQLRGVERHHAVEELRDLLARGLVGRAVLVLHGLHFLGEGDELGGGILGICLLVLVLSPTLGGARAFHCEGGIQGDAKLGGLRGECVMTHAGRRVPLVFLPAEQRA